MGSLICLTPQPDKHLYGQRQSGWMEVGMLLKTGIHARCFSVVTHWGYSSLLVFSNLWMHISGLVCCCDLTFPWRHLGVRMQLLGGGCKQDQLQHENVQHWHCLFVNHNDSLWLTFTYLNVKITCVLIETSDSGCGFTSGHFLINGWTVLGLEKTLLRSTALSLYLFRSWPCVWRD